MKNFVKETRTRLRPDQQVLALQSFTSSGAKYCILQCESECISEYIALVFPSVPQEWNVSPSVLLQG